MFDNLMRLLLDPEGSEGGGAPPAQPQSSSQPSSSSSSEKSDHSELANKIESLIRKNDNEPSKAIEKLLEETFSLREKRRQDKAQYEQKLAELQGKVPGEDAVVLRGDDLTAWNALQELGGPTAVKARLEELTPAAEKVQKLEFEERMAGLAEKHQYNPKVLGKLLSDAGLADAAQFDEKKKKVMLTVDGSEERIALDRYAEQNWKDFLPALKAGSPGKPNLHDPRRPQERPPDGVSDAEIRRMASL